MASYVFPPDSISVLDTLSGKSVFITGCTGFLGKVLVEKLLRCIPEIGFIYLLVRPAKGCTANERVHREIIMSPIFARLRGEIGDSQFEKLAKTKLIGVSGDLCQNRLGLSKKDVVALTQNVSVIWHCAASVEFNLRLDQAVEMNVYGSMRVLDIAEECNKLECFVHISTAYVNCTRTDLIEEKLYPCDFDIPSMLSTISRLSVRELQKVTVERMTGDWPNTYTFSKFISEHMIVERCRNADFALAVVRPTIVGGSWIEPVPGWVDCLSAAGAMYVAVGLGIISVCPGKPEHIGDIVPVDFVVNTMLIAVPSALAHPDRTFICQAAASAIKPWRWQHAMDVLPPWFESHPSRHSLSPRINFSLLSNQTMYELHMLAKYAVPSAILNAVALVGTKAQKRNAEQFQKLVVKVHSLIDAFRYFGENEWHFDFKALVPVGQAMCAREQSMFWLDLTRMDNAQYHTTFAYGLYKFVLKEELYDVENPLTTRQVCLNADNTRPANGNAILYRLLPDLTWVTARLQQQSISGPSLSQMKASVLASARVQAVLAAYCDTNPDTTFPVVLAGAAASLDLMIGQTSPLVMTGMATAMRKLLRRLYDNVYINAEGIEQIRLAASQNKPIIYVPTHRSYVDFLIVSYMCFVHRLPMPYIAAGEDFLDVAVVQWLFRHSGAFYIRRSFGGDPVYKALFEEYVRQLLCMGQAIEFYIEGGRSRSGKMLHPRLGILQSITEAVMSTDVTDALIVPIAINYEQTLEGNAYSHELHGNSKIKETLKNLVSGASTVLTTSFGRVSARIGDIISVKDFVAGRTDLRAVNRLLAYRVACDLSDLCEIMPTHMLATLLLMYRRGISRAQLLERVEWLRKEIIVRSGRVTLFAAEKIEWVVDKALVLLKDAIDERHRDVFEPKISQRKDYPNMLLLGHYRNKLVHVFFRESIWACAFHSIGLDSDTGVDKTTLFESARFLFALLKREILCGPDPDAIEDFEVSFAVMITRGVFRVDDTGRVEIVSEAMFSFLCAMCWPFIDSYYAAGLLLHTLDGPVEEHLVLQRTQWLATTLYHESMICFYESCSSDTLRNALTTFEGEFGVASRVRQRNVVPTSKVKNGSSVGAKKPIEISITPKYQDGELLQQLIHRIDQLRKRPPVVRSSIRRAMIAEIPLLAKL